MADGPMKRPSSKVVAVGGGAPGDQRATAIMGRTSGAPAAGMAAQKTKSANTAAQRAKVTKVTAPKASVATIKTSAPPKARPTTASGSGKGLLGKIGDAMKKNAGNNQSLAKQRQAAAARKG